MVVPCFRPNSISGRRVVQTERMQVTPPVTRSTSSVASYLVSGGSCGGACAQSAGAQLAVSGRPLAAGVAAGGGVANIASGQAAAFPPARLASLLTCVCGGDALAATLSWARRAWPAELVLAPPLSGTACLPRNGLCSRFVHLVDLSRPLAGALGV